MSYEEIRGQVRDLAGRFGIEAPDIVMGSVPWRAGAVITLKSVGNVPGTGRGRPVPLLVGGPLPVFIVDPPLLAGMPGEERAAVLAHPLAQLALGQPWRRRRRTNLTAALISLTAVGVVAALSWPLPAWAGAVALGVAGALLVDVATIRSFVYEADRSVAEVLGEDGLMAYLDHLQAHPPPVRGWLRAAVRVLPSPARRARRLSRSRSRGRAGR